MCYGITFITAEAVGRFVVIFFFFFQAEDGIRSLVRSRGLGDVYKRQELAAASAGGLSRR